MAYAVISFINSEQEYVLNIQSDATICLIADIANLFLIAFLLWEMLIPYRKWYLVLYFVISFILNPYLFQIAPITFLIIAATSIAIYGLYNKVKMAIWPVIGILGLVVHIYLASENLQMTSYNLDILLFIACIVISVSQKVKLQNEEKQKALNRSAVLENELLKKNIKPHFIFNSLTSLQELIEQSPKDASDFVEQLADEFRLVNKISTQTLISIEDELNLCRIHLRIMEHRKGAHFSLHTEGISGDEMIPPGIFHTLMENGITHGYGTKREGYFELKKTVSNNTITYTLFNDGEIQEHQENPVRKGTGLKYVEARLQESYTDNWTLSTQQVEGGWLVKIKIKTKQ